ncbi:hypothetical protein UQW22_01150 [Isoptericola halotolerans]|uniref:hypothetical protein n=1 Tax=Isoptericola halotolerans TaxID=300560 RepID=UPI00388D0555
MNRIRNRRRLTAALTALVVAPSFAACSFEVGEIEPVGEDAEASATAEAEPDAGAAAEGEDPAAESGAADEPAATTELATVHAEHVAARIPSTWVEVGADSGWASVYRLETSNGGSAGDIRFMPAIDDAPAMTAQEGVDWFISMVEGQGVTDEDYAPVTTLRDEDGRANTSYTYTTDGQQYVAVVWALVDGNGVPSLVQLSGAPDVVTQDLVATVDQNLNLNGDWEGTAG